VRLSPVAAAATILGVLSVLLAAPVQAQSLYRFSQAAVLGGRTADIAVTLDNNAWANLVEVNPLIARADGSASPTRLVFVSAGMGALELAIQHHWRKAGHPKVAVVAGFIAASLSTSIAIRNARAPERRRR
jgi:hypothetical protein